MKKKIVTILCILAIFILACIALYNTNYNKSNLKTIKVAEVTHSIFYAPQYIAISEGFFEEVGLDVELILTPGADKVTAAVLSGDVDIGFSGSEATIYVYNGGEKDYLKSFAQLTQKDGSFIISRKPIENFTLQDLVGKYIIGGRSGGMPEMTLEWTLRNANINPSKDLIIDTSIAFAAMGGAFIGGTGDFVTLFEPTATSIENGGFGHIVASLGELGGIVPYTAYNARNSYIKNNPEIIESFTKAIEKGLAFVHENNNETIAKSILSFFPDTSLNDLTKSIERYKNQDTWPKTTKFSEESFIHMQKIMQQAGVLDTTVNYKDLVYIKD